jgi:signal transduction histidine kinase
LKLVHSQALNYSGQDDSAAPVLIEALHCLRVAVTVFDSAERLIFANRHFSYLFRSLPPRAELTGMSYEQLIRLEVAGGEIAPDEARDLQRFIARRRAQFREGEYRPLDIHLAGGRIVEIKARRTQGSGWIALWSDVTEARHAQRRIELTFGEKTRALAETATQAERQAGYLADFARRFDETEASADTTKTTLMRSMSHELKTPLNAIIGFSDLILTMNDRLSAEQVQEYTRLIHEGGRNLLCLINQILDLTKLSAGRYELHRERVDMAEALSSVRFNFETKAAAKFIILGVEAAPGLIANADENAFGATLSHLVDNAVQYTEAGGAVMLSAAREGDRICVRVADNGPGIARQDIARILKPFERGGRRIADHAAGVGLGLTLAKALAEAQGGTLTIDSDTDRGFRATIALPAAN